MEQTDELDRAELGLIGATLNSPELSLTELDYNPTYFRHPITEQVWRVMHKLVQDGKPVDPITVSNSLANSDMPVDKSILYQSLDAAPSPASANFYATIVTEHAARRRLATVRRAIAEIGRASCR